jgi:hypothetical protein
LYHLAGKSSGCKRSPVKAFEGYLVLYHLGLHVTLLLSPFLDIWIATLEITWFAGNPFLLGCLLASRLATKTRTGTLAIADAVIGNEESAAELALFGQ